MKTVALFLLLLFLSGCSGNPAPESPHVCILRQDVKIALDAPAAPVLAALGAPFGYGERKSGRFRGVEKTYRFSGLSIRTYPGRDGDRILGLGFTDGSLQTPEGIALGATAEQVRACYGDDAIRGDRCILNAGRDQLILDLKNDAVTSIQYSLPPRQKSPVRWLPVPHGCRWLRPQ